jgi:hypothetical protein
MHNDFLDQCSASVSSRSKKKKKTDLCFLRFEIGAEFYEQGSCLEMVVRERNL